MDETPEKLINYNIFNYIYIPFVVFVGHITVSRLDASGVNYNFFLIGHSADPKTVLLLPDRSWQHHSDANSARMKHDPLQLTRPPYRMISVSSQIIW